MNPQEMLQERLGEIMVAREEYRTECENRTADLMVETQREYQMKAEIERRTAELTLEKCREFDNATQDELAQAQLEKAKIETTSARLLAQQYRNLMRPSLTLRAEVAVVHGPNGDAWTATYGDCVGHGPTPETACQDFDQTWAGCNDE